MKETQKLKIMYKYFNTILFFALTWSSYGQNCLPSGITFTSQADIDAFPSNYPNCSEIDGDVLIRPSSSCNDTPTDISNLDSLIQITFIHGSLKINTNPNLIDLSGLNSLTNIGGGLTIYCNHNLTSLNGLNNLVNVNGLVDIGYYYGDGNDKLKNLTGLSNLVNPALQIINNKSFENFVGLNAVNSLRFLTVSNCDSLENFVGLENVSTIISHVEISENDSNFDFTGLGNLTTIEGSLTLSNNSNQNVNGLTSLNEIQEELHIADCPLLADINGFNNLTSVAAIHLELTPLTSLSGLQNFSNFTNPNSNLNALILYGNTDLNDVSDLSLLDITYLDDLVIYENPMLSECAIESICNAINYNPPIFTFIEDNMSGCNSIDEVETACSILPVFYSKELTAIKKNKYVILNFSVAEQINSSHFEVQHSIDGKIFRSIGRIEGLGTTSKEIAYEYKHDSPVQGINYYRIKQVDFDNNFKYGNMTSIQFKNEGISINPNPVVNEIILHPMDNKSIFSIYNIQGKIMLKGILEDNNRINVSNFDKGLYIIKIHGLSTQKFIKL